MQRVSDDVVKNGKELFASARLNSIAKIKKGKRYRPIGLFCLFDELQGFCWRGSSESFLFLVWRNGIITSQPSSHAEITFKGDFYNF